MILARTLVIERNGVSADLAPESLFSGVHIESDVPGIAADIGENLANSIPPLRRAADAGILERIGEWVAAAIGG